MPAGPLWAGTHGGRAQPVLPQQTTTPRGSRDAPFPQPEQLAGRGGGVPPCHQLPPSGLLGPRCCTQLATPMLRATRCAWQGRHSTRPWGRGGAGSWFRLPGTWTQASRNPEVKATLNIVLGGGTAPLEVRGLNKNLTSPLSGATQGPHCPLASISDLGGQRFGGTPLAQISHLNVSREGHVDFLSVRGDPV